MLIVIIGALTIGLSLGLLGSGGSAITVPVLVYVVGHSPKESVAESMAIVGLISIAAAIPYAKSKDIDWNSVWIFGIPAMIGTLLGAWLAGFASGELQLMVFGGVLLLAVTLMVRKPGPTGDDCRSEIARDSAIWKMAIEGSVVGVVTGFVGVGGGFLIVPALVLMRKIPMRLAIGTSLAIVTIKAAVGFAKYEHYLLTHGMSVDTNTILIFSVVGIFGSQLGWKINTHLNQRRLRQVFAGLLTAIAIFVLVREASPLLMSKPKPADAIENARLSKIAEVACREGKCQLE